MSIGGERDTEVEDESGNFVPLSYENIDAIKKGNFYSDIL